MPFYILYLECKISFSKGSFKVVFNGYWKEIEKIILEKFNFVFIVYEFFI